VCAAQGRAALEDELEWSLVGGGDRRKRLDDESILLDKRRVRQPELLLHFDQLLKCGPTESRDLRATRASILARKVFGFDLRIMHLS
jgi:hypothetical protein